MNPKSLIYLLCGCVFLMYSCDKSIPDSKSDFIGHWETNTTILIIYEDGSGEYEYNGTPYDHIKGYVKITNKKIKICYGVRCKEFNIDTEPTDAVDSSGNTYTYMILDGETFIKK